MPIWRDMWPQLPPPSCVCEACILSRFRFGVGVEVDLLRTRAERGEGGRERGGAGGSPKSKIQSKAVNTRQSLLF